MKIEKNNKIVTITYNFKDLFEEPKELFESLHHVAVGNPTARIIDLYYQPKSKKEPSFICSFGDFPEMLTHYCGKRWDDFFDYIFTEKGVRISEIESIRKSEI